MFEQIAQTGHHPTIKDKDTVTDALWRASCSAGAVITGTTDGVKEELYKEIINRPLEACLDTAGGIAFGLAMSAMPRWVAVPCALAAGASMFSFVSRGAVAVQKCMPDIEAAAESPDRARYAVASTLGPIVTEGLYMAAASALTAGSCRWLVSKSNLSSLEFLRSGRLEGNLDLQDGELKTVTRLTYGPEILLSFRTKSIADAIDKPFSRTRFKSVSIEDLVCNEAYKKRLVHQLPHGVNTQLNANEIGIPTQFRQYRQVGLTLQKTDDPLATMYRSTTPSIVRIGDVDKPGDKPFWGGTGFFTSADGKIATALHVVENSKNIAIQTCEGKTLPAKLIAHDFDRDLALLQVQSFFGPFKPIALADTGRLADGEKLFVFGHPAGSKGLFVSPGLFDREELGKHLINYVKPGRRTQTLYAGHPCKGYQYFVHSRGGNSGGPVLNTNAEVIAVHTNGSAAADYRFASSGYGTAVEELKTFLKRSCLEPLTTSTVWKKSDLPLAEIKQPLEDLFPW